MSRSVDATPFATLTSPLSFGTRRARNRIVNAGHSTLLGQGSYNWDLLAYMEARAAGGAAIIVSQANYVTDDYGDIKFTSERMLPELAALATAIQRHDALAVLQLQHPGRQARYSGVGADIVLAPSQVPARFLGGTWLVPHAMDDDDIESVVAAFGFAAGLAERAGLDGVELHFAHGNLVEQFLSAETNHRVDRWGGSPTARRLLAARILEAVRSATSGDFVVGARVTGGVPGDPAASARCLDTIIALDSHALLDYLSVTVGHYSSGTGGAENLPDASFPRAAWADFGRAVKAATTTPIVLVGRINDPQTAEQLLLTDACDLVAMARPLIADPELPALLARGQASAARPCVGVQACWTRVAGGQSLRCAFNPTAGREAELAARPLATAPSRLQVAVVGAGPAGMEFARRAAELGHEVELIEAAAQLGGQLRTAALAPYGGELLEILDWYERSLRCVGVTIRTTTPATAAGLVSRPPDLVVLAAGSVAASRTHDGTVLPDAIDAVTAIAEPHRVGQRVVVFDERGGRVALCAAETLATRGHHVRFITSMTFPGEGVNETVRLPTCQRLGRLGVTFHPARSVTNRADAVVAVRDDYSGVVETWSDVDTLVTSLLPRSVDGLRDPLLAAGIRVTTIGDSRAPRGLVEATQDGFDLADSLGVAPAP